jgi:hypothetical protein
MKKRIINELTSATQNGESQNHLAMKCDKLHEVIWKVELFIIVYGR